MPSLNTGNSILSNAIKVSSTYNVGIGTTPSAWNTNFGIKVLDIVNGTLMGATSDISVINNGYLNSSGSFIYKTNDFATRYMQQSGEHRFYTAASGTAGGTISFSQPMTITSGGNVGIGTSSPTPISTFTTLEIRGATGGGIKIGKTSTAQFNIQQDGTDAYFNNTANGSIFFYTNDTERMRITSGGSVLIGTTTDSGARITARFASSGNPTISATNTNASNSRCYYGQKASGSTDDYYMIFDNAVDNKFLFYGNGGLGNVQANNVNISDERTKKDIIPLESYWDKFKAIEIVKFKYLDQNHNDYNIGVIAQQVESVAPEFIDAEDWGKDTPTQTEEPLKSVYTTDLYHATIKVLQEAMAKIEELETKLQDQQQTINSLINR